MNKMTFAKSAFLLMVAFFSLVSCDKDFNTIGSDIVGDPNFDFNVAEYEVESYDSITGPVQCNNLKVNSLGVYNNGVFGTSASHFVTQVELPAANMQFGANPEVDSVWVYVPYFSTQTGTDENGIKQFELDSVYGGANKFKLKVYENGYYLGNYNPENENNVQRHYSDEKSKVENLKRGHDGAGNSILNGMYLNDSNNVGENVEFSFNPDEKIIYKTDGNGNYLDANGQITSDASKRQIKERFNPGIWLNLNKNFFKEKILKASPSNLVNNNVFKDYFRGLYFQVEEADALGGAKAMLDFSKGYIQIEFKVDGETSTSPKIPKTVKLALAGNTINFFDTDYSKPNVPEHLYLNGGNGSVAYINMFGPDGPEDEDSIPDDLQEMIGNGWLINEANLVFYIDQTAMGTLPEPRRIYLYDAKNQKTLVDYVTDATINNSDSKKSKIGFGGMIEKDASGRGVKYKIRITDYLKNCIKNTDSTNYKLGLVVTEDINTAGNAYLKPQPGVAPKKSIPVASVLNPLGTVLYSSSPINGDKRLKLQIYYTKPK